MKQGVNESWSFATDDGLFEVSGNGHNCAECVVRVHRPSTGYGPMETPDITATITVAADDWHEIVAAVGARLKSPKRSRGMDPTEGNRG